jgi:hypothetical protein
MSGDVPVKNNIVSPGLHLRRIEIESERSGEKQNRRQNYECRTREARK